MDSLYPKLSTEYQVQWAPDGQTLYLYNKKRQKVFRLSRASGQVLCSLDGRTWPGENTDLAPKTVYRYLRLFSIHGLLEEAGSKMTIDSGTILWKFPFPCPWLRIGRPIPALWIYRQLVDWLWLPLLAAVLVVCSQPGVRLPRLNFGPVETILCLLLCNILAIILHELAHAAAANAFGVPVSSFGFGLKSHLPCCFTMIPLLPFAPRHIHRAVSRAGPLSNLCLGCVLLLLCLKAPFFHMEPVFLAAVGNLIIAVINLLPLEGFDGNDILCTFPPLEQALYQVYARGSSWERFLTASVGRLLNVTLRVGLFAFILYDVLCVLSLILEVLVA